MTGEEEQDAVVGSESQTHASSAFVWDDDTKLYYHASTGFYHDPNAGWYYSSRDGCYYIFQDGRYVLLPCNEKGEESEVVESATYSSLQASQDEAVGVAENAAADGAHNPPSEWLEEMLIDLYLSGYPNSDVDHMVSSTCLQTNDTSCEENSCEENWQAQYGQVVRSDDKGVPSFPVVDLWDWAIVTETVKEKSTVSKLIGRTVKCSSKLHPSVKAGGLLRTAAICEVHLDLVRVASGKVYQLRSPNKRYLASISSYDASNPTKDWGFPDLYTNLQSVSPDISDPSCQSYHANEILGDMSCSKFGKVPNTTKKHQKLIYRDRAAERRMLHGDFSIAPGQKCSENDEASSYSQYYDAEDAAAEAINLSFGSGSYGRRILENMGWNHGEGLGKDSRKGILEPLRAVGNKGSAGLGWNNSLRNA